MHQRSAGRPGDLRPDRRGAEPVRDHEHDHTTAPPTTTTPAPTPTATAAPPLSPETLFTKTYDGRNLKQVREIGSTAAYQQYIATFDGDGLTISGRLLVPRGNGPFPAVVLAHGYADPAVYDNTSQMSRERDYLARQGYVTLLVDYRNHALSSKDPDADANLRLGYAVDVINAAKALQQDPRVRPDRIALMGRSMGGGVTYTALVAAPGLFKAGIAYAPVSSNSVDNFEKWTRPDRATTQRVVATLGEPAANPDGWAKDQPAHLLRPDHRAGADPPGHRRPVLPDRLGPGQRRRPQGGGEVGRVLHVPRAAARVHDRSVDHVDPAQRRLPPAAPRVMH